MGDKMSSLLNTFPVFELSYETISHKKVSNEYDICLAIPVGKKAYIWFTIVNGEQVCYLFELNKDKKIIANVELNIPVDLDISIGTFLYGTIMPEKEKTANWFIVEDILLFKGHSLQKSLIHEKLLVLEEFMYALPRKYNSIEDTLIILPVFWKVGKAERENTMNIPEPIVARIPYTIHHIQYRCSMQIMPFLNVFVNKRNSTDANTLQPSTIHVVQPSKMLAFDFSKPQYKTNTVFHVKADIQYDIYHLYAYGKQKQLVYYNVAYVPNYKSSTFLNGIFRNIRENTNLDYIEESEDEEEFEKNTLDKYVDTNKSVLMECIFNHKFKKWTPIRVVNPNTKVVHISNLVAGGFHHMNR